jgi:hypothetical protein
MTTTMSKTILLSLLCSATLVTGSYALVVPDLPTLTPKVFGSQLDFKVAFGSKENPFQMQGLRVELDGVCRRKSKSEASSGIFEASVVDKRPYYISEKGLQEVHLENGGWELRWPKKSRHGVLLCSFIVPTALKRNDAATLEAGRFFMHHRIWSAETLESERERRRTIQAKAAVALKERDEQVKKLVDDEETTLTKVVSYGKAAKSMSQFRDSGLKEAGFTPLYDDQVLQLVPRDCILSTRGLIYKASETRGELLEYAGESRVDFPKAASTTTADQEKVVDNADG